MCRGFCGFGSRSRQLTKRHVVGLQALSLRRLGLGQNCAQQRKAEMDRARHLWVRLAKASPIVEKASPVEE